MSKFEVKQTSNGKFMISGTKGYTIRVDNRFDAIKHANYLNRQDELVEQFRQQNIEYYTVLTKIKMLTDQIHRQSGELHVVELAIKIRKLIREAIP